MAIKNKIDLLIDDLIKRVENVESAGIKSVLFTSEVNKNQDTSVPRVTS